MDLLEEIEKEALKMDLEEKEEFYKELDLFIVRIAE